MRSIIKILAALFIPVAAYFIWNYNSVTAGLSALNPQSIVVMAVMFITAAPFLWILGKWIQAKIEWKAHGNLLEGTRVKKALPPEKRRKLAREYINELRMTDPAMMASNNNEMVIVRHELSPSREDAIQWESFAFTPSQVETMHNPELGIDGITFDKVFFVVENCMTGECSLHRFNAWEDATSYLFRKWQAGVMKIEASEYDKILKAGFVQQLGGEIAKKSVKDKDEGEKE